MNTNEAVQSFSALAHESRLDLFRCLVKMGPEGSSVGQLAEATSMKFGTVSAQLTLLAQSGLVASKRQGRTIIYHVNFDAILSLAGFLMKDCCGGADQRVAACCEILDCDLNQ